MEAGAVALPLARLSRREAALNMLPAPTQAKPKKPSEKPDIKKAWTNLEEAGRSYFCTDWRGQAERQIASRNNFRKFVISYAKAEAREFRKKPETYHMTEAEKAAVKRTYQAAKDAAIARFGDPTRLNPETHKAERKALMKRINGEALRASAKLSASIRREGGHMNGFGASRYPDMGGDFYDRQRVEAPSEEEQARIRAVQQHVAEQMWPGRI
ncbi:hypothetical protein PAPYR_12067 [Paratrimastix pyriformis]|uniref:Uncharacterized protein n=1 Tax=Paratrimastix pyriformis TaxID=342808 RepID=A0ABQ8U759_9EUKA|nr:hypothetical protein PAPYR_13110 [Paratrimastix pyriformis]KAJ4453241.1 hypothetical protein PAPYR_12335 [Paratrimastix pyriformis]KAJ4453437.1 hypothetical protein PAPYR_12067 [Paratrimastix pyriformis]